MLKATSQQDTLAAIQALSSAAPQLRLTNEHRSSIRKTPFVAYRRTAWVCHLPEVQCERLAIIVLMSRTWLRQCECEEMKIALR
jgi:hypothetical protein